MAVKFYRANIAAPSQDVLTRLTQISDHPDLVRLIRYETTDEGLFEVMEYAEGGVLRITLS